VSPRTLHTGVHLSCPTPRECENPTEPIGRILLVWKPTILSDLRIRGATSFLAKCSPHFALLYCSSPAPSLARQAGCANRLGYIDSTRSAVLRLPRSRSNSTPSHYAHNLFCCYELTSGFRTRGLTKGTPERYTAVLRGRSRRASLIQSPNDPLARLSPEILESAV
jgi:hypothetical protein